ncbi:hypothetical protein DCC81_23490 [Chitinophaga parva]|uniref:Uncharacterized protein n=1 Tax=Chitinophaga parva TaxID=2169414 RepID=A0A2T7BE42_9BACT|nr:hypothetical protein DCC81_23490 [Chitinophaga parva]
MIKGAVNVSISRFTGKTRKLKPATYYGRLKIIPSLAWALPGALAPIRNGPHQENDAAHTVCYAH